MCRCQSIRKIKIQYNKLSQQAYQAYMRGCFKESNEFYDKAFFQARMLLKLPDLPVESINYLVMACKNCIDYCHSSKPAELYLDITLGELRNAMHRQYEEGQLNENTLGTFLHIIDTLVSTLKNKKEYAEASEVEVSTQYLWKHYSEHVVCLH